LPWRGDAIKKEGKGKKDKMIIKDKQDEKIKTKEETKEK
jgi:hypothetical protein